MARGRPRKKVKRTASGQPSRSAEAKADAVRVAFEEGPMQVALKARRRHAVTFKEPANAASASKWRKRDARPVSKDEMTAEKLQHRGSVIGRLWADGRITDQQLAAGSDYCERYIRYAALHGLPAPTPQGISYGEVRGGSRPDRLRAAMEAKRQHDADQNILRKCSAGVIWAIKRACVLDDAAPEHMICEGLQALVSAGR